LPVVTVQLPIYNEMYVADRLIEAVCRLDYPRELLEIQVLDDSTDETCEIAELAVRRTRRTASTSSTSIAQTAQATRRGARKPVSTWPGAATSPSSTRLSAGFGLPPQLLPHFGDPKVGMVQARWGHINQDYSLLTKIQSILLDGHFILEHGGRNRAGRFFNFNGTAGIWRRRDHRRRRRVAARHADRRSRLELSRAAARLAVHLPPDVVSPAEVPVEMNALQVAAAPMGEGLDPDVPQAAAAAAAGGSAARGESGSVFPPHGELQLLLMSVLCVLMFPSMVIRYDMGWYEMLLIDVPLFFRRHHVVLQLSTWCVSASYT
jgi:hypothetical protein